MAQCFPGPYGGDFYWEEFRGIFEPRWKESACCSVNLIKIEPKGEYGAIRNIRLLTSSTAGDCSLQRRVPRHIIVGKLHFPDDKVPGYEAM